MKNLGQHAPGAYKRPATAQARLTEAYNAVFTGNGSKEDAEIVLSDLADWSGFYKVTPIEAPADHTKFAEGGRWVFSRILSFLRMSQPELSALEEAARREANTVYKEDII